MRYFCIIWVILIFANCKTASTPQPQEIYASENLKIIKFSDHVYQHISYLDTENWGKVPCNGMILTDENESVIFDTTIDNASSIELINFVENQLNTNIQAIVPTHFHEDCLGGLDAFHAEGIPSFALDKTIQLARENKVKTLPQNAFKDRKIFNFGKRSAVAVYLGEGHTSDNIVAYYTDEKVLFGGCLVKEINAGKGYLGDANVAAWPRTIKNVKRHYKQVNLVIPGHGKAGGIELLDYTRELFDEK